MVTRRSRLQIARPDIQDFLQKAEQAVFRVEDLAHILQSMRAQWRLAQRTTVEEFADYLVDSFGLEACAFGFPHGPRTVVYARERTSVLEILKRLRPNSYFSHYTAMRLHALTEQVPKAIYLTEERSRAVDSLEVEAKQDEMTQSSIDAAFARPPRTSSNSVIFHGMRIYLLQGAGTDRAGVQPMEADNELTRQRIHVDASDVERTLIDATVRPFYSGGVGEVAAAFVEAKERVSVNRIRALLTQMRMIYPYHQAIGWYLERAGFRPAQLALLQSMPMTLDFHLAHEMTQPRYVKEWRLFVPRDF